MQTKQNKIMVFYLPITSELYLRGEQAVIRSVPVFALKESYSLDSAVTCVLLVVFQNIRKNFSASFHLLKNKEKKEK